MRHFRVSQPLYKTPKTSFLAPYQLRIQQTLHYRSRYTRYRNSTSTVTSTHQRDHTLKQGHTSNHLNEVFAIRLEYHNQKPNSTNQYKTQHPTTKSYTYLFAIPQTHKESNTKPISIHQKHFLYCSPEQQPQSDPAKKR